jgi:hypothetical protein
VGGACELTIDPSFITRCIRSVPLTTLARFLGALVSQCLAEDEIPFVHRQMFSEDRYLTLCFNGN